MKKISTNNPVLADVHDSCVDDAVQPIQFVAQTFVPVTVVVFSVVVSQVFPAVVEQTHDLLHPPIYDVLRYGSIIVPNIIKATARPIVK